MKTFTLRKWLYSLACLWCMLAVPYGSALAQETGTVNGQVINTKGMPLVGVSVIIKGTTQGVSTNLEGGFQIEITPGDILSISYMGYKSVELPVSELGNAPIVLEEDVSLLDEVVIVGYGTVKKKDLTGAVGSIKSSDIGDVSVTDVGQMIQGRIAGVSVTNNNGLPGSGTKIHIRGTGTFYNSDPLYIIDGMPGDFSAVNAYDIESIEILKDASATAIYGARAANGVVLVTTHRGKTGAPKVTFNAYVGFSETPKQLDMLNADQFMDLAKEIDPLYLTASAKRFVPVSEGGLGYTEEWGRVTRNDIQDAIFRKALQQEYHINVSGGGQKVTYSFSAGYQNQDAIIKGYNYQKFNISSNTEYKWHDILKIGNNLTLTRSDIEGVPFIGYGNSLMSALQFQPYLSLYDSENSWGYTHAIREIEGQNAYNPLPELFTRHATNKGSVIQDQLYVEVEPMTGLKLRSQLIYTQSSSYAQNWNKYYENAGTPQPAQLTKNLSWAQSSTWENYITYDKQFNENHNISVMVGMSSQIAKFNDAYGLGALGQGSTTVPWTTYDVLMVTKTPVSVVNNESITKNAYLSYFGRINYSFKNRYLFTFNYRQDASPNFGPKNRWGHFPSAAVAWKINEESFLKEVRSIDQLKLRFSWGLSGNDRIPSYQYQNILHQGYLGNFGTTGCSTYWGSSWYQGTTSVTMPSPDIKWEESESYNVGVDLSMWQNRFTASVDLYLRDTRDLLVRVPIAGSSGLDVGPMSNAASVRNKGIDISLGYNGSIGKDFRYSVSGVFGYVHNEVTSLGKGQPILGGNFQNPESFYATITQVGSPIGAFYGYVVDKVLSTQAEADAYNAKFGLTGENAASPGDLAFKDLDNNNTIDDNGDRTIIGNSIPKYTYGFNINLYYKQFDFSIGGAGVAGVDIYNNFNHILDAMKYTSNASTDVLKRWRKEGDVTSVPRATSSDPNRNNRMSDRYISSGNYLKIRNITLGYTFRFKENKYFDNIRVYTSVQNAFCFTNFEGYDPELGASSSMGAGDAMSYNLQRNIAGQMNNFPTPRTYLLGVQIAFK